MEVAIAVLALGAETAGGFYCFSYLLAADGVTALAAVLETLC
jgi:hypothetical protein